MAQTPPCHVVGLSGAIAIFRVQPFEIPALPAKLRGNPCIARALRAHCALLLDYVPPEEPLGTPLGNTLRVRRLKVDWREP